jgi:hypothetical protein
MASKKTLSGDRITEVLLNEDYDVDLIPVTVKSLNLQKLP